MPALPSRNLQTGVYQIRNLVNGKVYVGSASRSFKQRWKLHYNSLKRGDHCNPHLQNAWNHYGEANFAFEIVQRCTPEECLTREQWWINKLQTIRFGYNMCPTAGTQLGIKRGPETLKKLSKSHTGLKQSEESRAKRAESLRDRYFSPEHRSKISKAMRGRKLSASHKAKAKQASAKGKVQRSLRCRLSQNGYKLSPLEVWARTKK